LAGKSCEYLQTYSDLVFCCSFNWVDLIHCSVDSVLACCSKVMNKCSIFLNSMETHMNAGNLNSCQVQICSALVQSQPICTKNTSQNSQITLINHVNEWWSLQSLSWAVEGCTARIAFGESNPRFQLQNMVCQVWTPSERTHQSESFPWRILAKTQNWVKEVSFCDVMVCFPFNVIFCCFVV
jgi:hypothetical protein